MPLPPSSLVGSVVERKPGPSSSFKSVPAPSPLGFPSAQHRSKSAFARARETKQNATRDSDDARTRVPIVRTSGRSLSHSQAHGEELQLFRNEFSGASKQSDTNASSGEEWRAQMQKDNDRAIAAMSEEERERHAAEIFEQLGPNVAELLRKAREARAQPQANPDTREQKAAAEEPRGRERQDVVVAHQVHEDSGSNVGVIQPTPVSTVAKHKFASPPRSILSQPSSRSSSPGRSARKLRFAHVTPKDVHVFQSEPPSPRRPIGLLLPAPPETANTNNDADMVPEIKLEPEVQTRPEQGPEEGTPEYIRRHFFPDAPANEPALEWIESNNATAPSPDAEPRFDLSGAIIPPSLRESLPIHLGLHHHGGSSAAGYTLSDLFLLARSSVPAQRATVLGVLSKIIRRLARREKEVSEIKDRDGVRSKPLVIGLAAITEKGTVGVQSIELVWTCIVYWDEDEVAGLEGVELRTVNAKPTEVDEENRSEDSLPSHDPISSLPFSALLPQVVVLLDSRSLPPESQAQLLSILLRFARHSVAIATAICETPRLVANVMNTFLLTPIPPSERGSASNPLALDFLHMLALSSRTNARSVEGPADALLRFVTTSTPLSASPFPRPLSEALLRGTLNLYTALGRYGLYSSVATTAAEHFNCLSSDILHSEEKYVPVELKVSWLRLLSVWMVCARDPHRTTPSHDLLWSQVAGWAWGDDLLEFRKKLLSEKSEPDGRLWQAVWDTLASWLEGCQVNSTMAGQDERSIVNAEMNQTWEGGVEWKMVNELVAHLQQELSTSTDFERPVVPRRAHLMRIAELSGALNSFARFCLACLPRQLSASDQEYARNDVASWITNAVPIMSAACTVLLSSDLLRSIRRKPTELRDDLSFRTQVLYMRAASIFLASTLKVSRIVPSTTNWPSESLAILQTLLPGDEESAEWLISEIVANTHIECASKLQFLLPFFKNMIRPDDTFYLSPLSPTPDSIQRSTTQCLPAECISRSSARPSVLGLPLSTDWPCVTLNHLLRSGTSPILTNPNSVPESWNASEIDLVQASLTLMLHVQKTLGGSAWREFAPTFEHVVFNCMKVFMLEHNQQQRDSNEEVFRDSTVGRQMETLLAPYTLRTSHPLLQASSWSDLEVVSKDFLGDGTPFFQLYTDFVALYDAISFSHPIFARLLLPPTSMAYALDYRKLLWGDYGHTLRSIRVSIGDVPSPDLRQFLWPVETDSEMLGWYLRALVKWPLGGFVRFVAVHHMASNIWPDLHVGAETNPAQKKRAQMLLVAIFNQAKTEVVREVVRYVQHVDDSLGLDLRLAPNCYECTGETSTARVAFVRSLGELQISDSAGKIFSE